MDTQFDELIARCRELDATDVVEDLGLSKARSRRKYACPACGSSDALHVYPGAGRGAHCFSCSEHFDVIELVRVTLDLEFRPSVEYLANRFGFAVILAASVNEARSRRLREDREAKRQALQKAEEQARAERRAEAVEVWRAMHEEMQLTKTGAEYLRSRGLLLEACEWVGIRSVETMQDWARLCEPFSDAELRAAGLIGANDRGAYPVPWNAPFLVIGYNDPNGKLDMLRFRALDGSKPKYIAPLGHRPRHPYLSAAAFKHERSTLYICEGEINALSVLLVDELAIGSAGASEWQDEWCEPFRAFERVVVLCDGDDAGSEFARRVARSVAATHGPDWTRRHVTQRRFAAGVDANDILMKGTLSEALHGI